MNQLGKLPGNPSFRKKGRRARAFEETEAVPMELEESETEQSSEESKNEDLSRGAVHLPRHPSIPHTRNRTGRCHFQILLKTFLPSK